MSISDAANYIKIFLQKQGFDECCATCEGTHVRKDGHFFLQILEEDLTPCNARVFLLNMCELLLADEWGRAEGDFAWTKEDSERVASMLNSCVCKEDK